MAHSTKHEPIEVAVAPLDSPSDPHVDDSRENRKRPLLITGLCVILAAAAVIGLVSHHHSSNSAATKTIQLPKFTIAITNSGFVPSDALVKLGTQVLWVNNTKSSQRVAADPYPTHSTLPGLISPTIPPHGTYSYVFAKSGHWGYQNYLHPTVNARVEVKN